MLISNITWGGLISTNEMQGTHKCTNPNTKTYRPLTVRHMRSALFWVVTLLTTRKSADLNYTAAEASNHATDTLIFQYVARIYTQRHSQLYTWPPNYGCSVFRICILSYTFCVFCTPKMYTVVCILDVLYSENVYCRMHFGCSVFRICILSYTFCVFCIPNMYTVVYILYVLYSEYVQCRMHFPHTTMFTGKLTMGTR